MTEIEPSILRILKSKDQIIGTGFLVSSTLAVTCAHVAIAAGMDGEYRIRVQFAGQKQPINATLLNEFLDLDRDIAILRLETVPEGIQLLRLGLAEHSPPGNSFRSFGYATAAGMQGIFANGSIDGYLRQHKLVQLQSPQANHGMSGAPVWDEQRGVVIGLITKGHTELGRNENTTFAIPTEIIWDICPELKLLTSVLPQQTPREAMSDELSINSILSDLRARAERSGDTASWERIRQLEAALPSMGGSIFTGDINGSTAVAIGNNNQILVIQTSNLSDSLLKQLITGENLGMSKTVPIQGARIPPPDSFPLHAKPFLIQNNLVQNFFADLHIHPWLALIDSPGKGKTQLAILVGENFKQVKWVSLKNLGQNTYNHFRDQIALWLTELTSDHSWWDSYISGLSIQQMSQLIATRLDQVSLLIIDDLPDPIEFEDFYIDLEIVAQALISHNTKIITTSQRALPPFIENRFDTSITKKSCPPFSEDDILELIKLENAPSKFWQDGIILWILTSTKGHPSLVIATIKWLKQSNWDYSLTTIDGLMTGEPIKETLEYSRRHLIKHLDSSAKEFLYRLSIVGDSFTRKRALEIASIKPSITNPGETLDFLIGPWLDHLENGDLSITPLLANSGTENLEFKTQQAIHRLIVKAFMSQKVIRADKAFTILLHLWQAQDYLEYGQVLVQLLMTVETRQQATYVDWATSILVGIEWPNGFDLNWRILIRTAQIRVSALAGKNTEKLNADLDLLLSQANPENNLLPILGAYITTGITNRDLPIEITIPRSFALLRLFVTHRNLVTEILKKELVEQLPDVVWGQGMRTKGERQMLVFLDEFSKLSEEEKDVLLGAFMALDVINHLMDQIWISEDSKPKEQQNWENILSSLDRIEMLPLVQENIYFKITCMRVRSIIFGDYLNKKEEAIELLETFSDLPDVNVNFLLNYSKGCHASNAGFTSRAVEYFTQAENTSGESFLFYRTENTRKLAIEKSKSLDWDAAKVLSIKTIRKFVNGKTNQQQDEDIFVWDRVEMLGELAFIYWNLGNRTRACAAFYGYAMRLVIEKDMDNLRYREAFNKAGHGLGWFLMMSLTGKPPETIISGEIYMPVTAGLFGLRREALGKYVPPFGFSKATLLLQIASFAYHVGLLRTAWKTFKLCLSYFESENRNDDYQLAVVYTNMTTLEMIYGDEGLALSYFAQGVTFWAASRASMAGKTRVGPLENQRLDFSIISDDDIKTAEKHFLYLVFAPVFLNFFSLELDVSKIISKLTSLEQLLKANDFGLLYRNDWLRIIRYFIELVNNEDSNEGPDLNFEALGDGTTFKILYLIVNSIKSNISLKAAFSMQMTALISLPNYNSMCRNMLPACGNILHRYWTRVSETQRFALHDPQGFADRINLIQPNMGGETIVKVMKNARITLNINVSAETLQNLEKLMSI